MEPMGAFGGVVMLVLGLLLSMLNLFYRDVGFIFRSIIQLWMLMTCVVYQLEATAGWKRIPTPDSTCWRMLL